MNRKDDDYDDDDDDNDGDGLAEKKKVTLGVSFIQ